MRGSPSSLFSAPSSPAPIPSPQPASSKPSMPPPLQTNAAEPPRRPPPSKPTTTGSLSKAVRKPTRFFEPKIKRFDAPNLKPGSTLPTKASLGTVKTSDLSQPSTSGRRDSIQTPTEASTPQSSSAPERSAFLGPGPFDDTQYHESPPQLEEIETPTMQDAPRLPPASSVETDAFLRDLMPPEYVALPMFAHWTQMCSPHQNVGTHDVRFSIRLCGLCPTEYTSLRDAVEPSHPTPVPVRKQSTSDLLK